MGLEYVDIFDSHRFDPQTPWKRRWPIRTGEAGYTAYGTPSAAYSNHRTPVRICFGVICPLKTSKLRQTAVRSFACDAATVYLLLDEVG